MRIPGGYASDGTALKSVRMKKIIIARSIMHAIGEQDTLFKRGNLAIFTVRTCEETLNLQGVHKADLIVVDAAMQLMGGIKLCSAIRGNSDLKSVSIIVTVDTEEEQARSREAGANAVVLKPIDSVQLFSRISEFLIIPQRRDLRVLMRATIKGRDKAVSFLGMSHNISISGMLIETDQVLSVGDRFSAVITVSHLEIPFECLVRRVVPSAPRLQYGVQFVNPDTKALIIVDQFVKGGIKL